MPRLLDFWKMIIISLRTDFLLLSPAWPRNILSISNFSMLYFNFLQQNHNVLLGRFLLQFFQKIFVLLFLVTLLLMGILSPLLFTDALQNAKIFFLHSKTFKLLLLDVNMVIQLKDRLHTKVKRCVNVFLLITNKLHWKTKNFAKIIINLSLYFENLVAAIFREHLSVTVSVMKNFHCNLQFLF